MSERITVSVYTGRGSEAETIFKQTVSVSSASEFIGGVCGVIGEVTKDLNEAVLIRIRDRLGVGSPGVLFPAEIRLAEQAVEELVQQRGERNE